MKLPIYLDYHATTPIDPRVLEAMMPYLTTEFGNAASKHHPFGWNAEKAVEHARTQIAHLIGAHPKEIIFTSGATESNNLALKGAAEMYKERGNHIITQATEHKCVLDTCKSLEKSGHKVTYLPVDHYGQIRLADLESAITDKTIVISIMHANNEIGTVQQIAEIGKIAKKHNILFHTDAAQSAGKIPVDVNAMNVDLLSISAHKLYGPKGVGILYVRSQNPRVRLSPLLHGGGHEMGFRSGTLNVPFIVGFGKAAEIAQKEMAHEAEKIQKLRDRLYMGLFKALEGGVQLNGHPSERLANNLNLSFSDVEADALITEINGEIAISTGSACSSQVVEPSHTLKALGLPMQRLLSSVRFGLGRFTTQEEIDYVIQRVVKAVEKVKKHSPFSQIRTA